MLLHVYSFFAKDCFSHLVLTVVPTCTTNPVDSFNCGNELLAKRSISSSFFPIIKLLLPDAFYASMKFYSYAAHKSI
jgi:hypothetical protein